MAKAYLIGGAPRVGKTTALKELIKQEHLLAVSSDTIRQTIRGVLDASHNHDLFKFAKGMFSSPKDVANMQNNPAIVVEHQNRESEVVWTSILDFIKSSVEVGQDIGVEGVAILPHNLTAKLPFEYRAVFITNLNDQTETILRHAHEDEYDWLHKYDDETIKSFCTYNIELNKYYYEEAKKYNLPTIIVEDDFWQSIGEAVKVLVS